MQILTVWRYINFVGWGVITKKARCKGEFLLEYTGEKITRKEAYRREAHYEKCGNGSFLFFFGKNWWVNLFTSHPTYLPPFKNVCADNNNNNNILDLYSAFSSLNNLIKALHRYYPGHWQGRTYGGESEVGLQVIKSLRAVVTTDSWPTLALETDFLTKRPKNCALCECSLILWILTVQSKTEHAPPWKMLYVRPWSLAPVTAPTNPESKWQQLEQCLVVLGLLTGSHSHLG